MADDSDDIVSFCLKWNLNDDAEAKLLALEPSVRHTVMQSFSPPDHMTEVSGKFIMFASSVQKGKGAKGKGGRSEEDDAQAFVDQWGLNEDATNKLMKLSPEHRQTVMQEFSPREPAGTVNGKFIVFASGVEKRSGKGAGKWGGPPPAATWPAPIANWAPALPAARHAGSPLQLAGGKAAGGLERACASFCGQWALNEDAQAKMYKLRPEVQRIVMESFNPHGCQPGQVDGKFIMFASSVEKANQPAAGAAADAWHGVQGGKAWPGAGSADAWGAGGKGGKASAAAGPGPDAHLAGFCHHWALNEDAQAKLYQLNPGQQEEIMSTFNPPEHYVEVSGKFIMFAASIQKGWGPSPAPKGAAPKGAALWGNAPGKTIGKGGGQMGDWQGVGGHGYEVYGAAPKGSGKTKGWQEPARQSPTAFLSPVAKRPRLAPAAMVGGSGKGCKAGSGIDYQALGFIGAWDLNEDAQKKLMELPPDVRAKVMADFNPMGTPQEDKGWSGKFISFAGGAMRSTPRW